jgi:bifunctional DNase/RNase
MAELVELLHARVDRVDVTELRDGAFVAEMTV